MGGVDHASLALTQDYQFETLTQTRTVLSGLSVTLMPRKDVLSPASRHTVLYVLRCPAYCYPNAMFGLTENMRIRNLGYEGCYEIPPLW